MRIPFPAEDHSSDLMNTLAILVILSNRANFAPQIGENAAALSST